MGGWTDDELDEIGESEEIDLASRRANGSLSAFVTMWVVRVGDDVYVRSAAGADRPWYRHALDRGVGTVRARGVERDVDFGLADPGARGAIDAAYHAKYDRYGAKIVGSVVSTEAHDVTIRLIPARDA